MVPLRTGFGRSSTLADALRTTSSALMGALRHQRFRYEDMVAEGMIPEAASGLGQRGLPGPMLNLMLFNREFRCGEATAIFHILTTSPVDDLSVNVYPAVGSGLMVDIEANPNRYTQAEVDERAWCTDR